MAEVNLGRFAKALEEPAYVAVGFGVLGFQRAQVCRRAWHRRLTEMSGSAGLLGNHLGERFEPLRQTVNDAAGEVAGNLPSEAREFLKAAGDVVGDLPGEALELLKEAVAFGRFALQVVQAPLKRQNYP